MRWWWFGPSVTRAELDRELTVMAQAGLGGVEVAYVYPLPTATTEFGSAAFLADLRYAAERAHELGLGFDLTLGSGWSFGGRHITPGLAARQLYWDRREIGPGALELAMTSPWPGEQLIAAYVGAGSLLEQPAGYEWLPVTDGRLRIEAGSAPRVVLLGYARPTGQNVKRAAAGAEGPVLDHYSAAATEAHLRAVGDPMLDAVPANLVGSVFCDSLEVYGADWTELLPAEFARRRGYELLPQLHLLTVDAPDAGRLRADYYHTLAELYGRTSSRSVSAGPLGEACPSESSHTERRPPPSAAIGSRTCSKARAGAGAGFRRPAGRPRRRTCMGDQWSPPRPGPGCIPPPSAPPRWT